LFPFYFRVFSFYENGFFIFWLEHHTLERQFTLQKILKNKINVDVKDLKLVKKIKIFI